MNQFGKPALFGLIAALASCLGSSAGLAFQAEAMHLAHTPRVWIAPDPEAKEIALVAFWRIGHGTDIPGKPGSALLTGVMSYEGGAGTYDGLALKSKFQDLGAQFSFSIADDTASAVLVAPKAKFADALDLVRQVLNEPRFDEGQVPRIRKALKSQLANSFKQPAFAAGLALDQVMFADHPQVRERMSVDGELPALTHDEMASWWHDHISRGNVSMGIAGAIEIDEAVRLLDRTFEKLADHASPQRHMLRYVFPDQRPILGVAQDTAQTQLVAAAPGCAFNLEQGVYAAAWAVLVDIAGGQGVGRLWRELREDRGLAYGAVLASRNTDLSATYFVVTSVPNEQASEALTVIKDSLRKIAGGGVTDKELAEAKARLKARFAREDNNPRAIATILAQQAYSGGSIARYRAFPDIVQLVSKDQVNELAQRILDPDGLAVALVGKPNDVANLKMVEVK